MIKCPLAAGRYNCKNCVMYDSDMGDCLADVTSKAYGEWRKNFRGILCCSNCKMPALFAPDQERQYATRFCPDCGARMKGT